MLGLVAALGVGVAVGDDAEELDECDCGVDEYGTGVGTLGKAGVVVTAGSISLAILEGGVDGAAEAASAAAVGESGVANGVADVAVVLLLGEGVSISSSESGSMAVGQMELSIGS